MAAPGLNEVDFVQRILLRALPIWVCAIVLALAAACARPAMSDGRQEPVEAPEAASVSSAAESAEESLDDAFKSNSNKEEKPATASEVQSLVVWTTPEQAGPMATLGQRFADEFAVNVHVEARELEEMLDDFRLSLAHQTDMPDIFYGEHDWIGLLAGNGVISPLNVGRHRADFAPGTLRAMSYGGQEFGVPVTVEGLALITNQDLAEKSPETWAELRQLAFQHVQATGDSPGLGVSLLNPYDTYPAFSGLGGDLFSYDPDSGHDTSNVRLDTEDSLQALVWLQEMRDSGLASADLGPAELHRSFAEGRLPFLIAGSSALQMLEDSMVDFSISAFPEGGKSFLGVQGYMINAFSQDPFQAWFFLSSAVVNSEGMALLLKDVPMPPAYLPMPAEAVDPRLWIFREIALRGVEVPTRPEMREVWRIWGEAHAKAILSPGSGADSYKEAAEEIRSLLET